MLDNLRTCRGIPNIGIRGEIIISCSAIWANDAGIHRISEAAFYLKQFSKCAIFGPSFVLFGLLNDLPTRSEITSVRVWGVIVTDC